MRIHDVQPGRGGLLVLSDRRGDQLPLDPEIPFAAEVLEVAGDRVLLSVGGRLLRCETTLPLEAGTRVWLFVKEASAQRIALALMDPAAGAKASLAPEVAPGGGTTPGAAAPAGAGAETLARAVLFLLANDLPATPEAVQSVLPLFSGDARLPENLTTLTALLPKAVEAGLLPPEALPPDFLPKLQAALESAWFVSPPPGAPLPDAEVLARQGAVLEEVVRRLGLDHELRLAEALVSTLPAETEPPAAPAASTAGQPTPAAAPPEGRPTLPVVPSTPAIEAQAPASVPQVGAPSSMPPAVTPSATPAPPATAAPAQPESLAERASPPAGVTPPPAAPAGAVEPTAPSSVAAPPARAPSPAPAIPWPPAVALAEDDLKGLLLVLRQVLVVRPETAESFPAPDRPEVPGQPDGPAEGPNQQAAAGGPEQPQAGPSNAAPPPAAQGQQGQQGEQGQQGQEAQSRVAAHNQAAPAPTGGPAVAGKPAVQPAEATAATHAAPVGDRLVAAVEEALHNLTGQRLLAPSGAGEGQPRLEFYLQLPVTVGDQRQTAELRLYREAGGRGRTRPDRPAALNLSCRLTTTHLGPVRLDFALRPKGTSEARLFLDREPVIALFRAHEPELREVLGTAGLRLGQVTYALSASSPPPGRPGASPTTGRTSAIDLRM